MDIADSFVNWGFNPQHRGGIYQFAITSGWCSDDGESGTNLRLFRDLESALIAFRGYIWDSYEYQFDQIHEVIEVDGDVVSAYNTQIVNHYRFESIYLVPGAYKYKGIVRGKVIYKMIKEYTKERIEIPLLTTTIPYDEQRFGDLEHGNADWTAYINADSETYKHELKKLNLKRYTEDIKRNYDKKLPLSIISESYRSDYNSSTSTLYFMP